MSSCLNCKYYDDCIKYFGELPKNCCERYKFDENKPKKPKKKTSLCCDCKRLDCSWMKNLEPVAGWEAIPTNVGYKTARGFVDLPSYCVISCPGYTPGQCKKK